MKSIVPAPLGCKVGPLIPCLHDGSEYTGSYVDTLSLEEIKTWHRYGEGRLSTRFTHGPLGHGVKSGLAEDGVGVDVDSQANLPDMFFPLVLIM